MISPEYDWLAELEIWSTSLYNLDFTNKTVLITGGTRGIGKAIYDDFIKCNAKVINISTKDVDLGDIDALQKYLDVILTENNHIDICVNNAGINKVDFLHDININEYDRIMNINLKAPFLICKEVSKLMKINNYGRIVNISSIAADRVRAGRTIYSTTKHALIGMTKNIAIDLAPYNILTNCVSPGFTETEMTTSILSMTEMRNLTSQIPLNRLGQPSEISKAVLFLASDLNTYITGQNLLVDGGYVNAVNA